MEQSFLQQVLLIHRSLITLATLGLAFPWKLILLTCLPFLLSFPTSNFGIVQPFKRMFLLQNHINNWLIDNNTIEEELYMLILCQLEKVPVLFTTVLQLQREVVFLQLIQSPHLFPQISPLPLSHFARHPVEAPFIFLLASSIPLL